MDDYRTIHWTRAVEINHIALTRIVAEIFALLGLVSGSSFDRLPQALYRSVERLLRPTESALRRLIVIAARGLVVKPLPKRPMPKGLKIARKAAGPKVSRLMSFRLFDTRKSFDFIQPENPLFVYVKTYSSNPFNPFSNKGTLPFLTLKATLYPFAAYAAFLILSSTVSPAFRAKLINASMLKLLMRPRSRSLRRGWVMSRRFAAAACVSFQALTCSVSVMSKSERIVMAAASSGVSMMASHTLAKLLTFIFLSIFYFPSNRLQATG